MRALLRSVHSEVLRIFEVTPAQLGVLINKEPSEMTLKDTARAIIIHTCTDTAAALRNIEQVPADREG